MFIGAGPQWLTPVILSYSGRRDQEDQGLKPAWANSSRDPISKKPITKIGLVEWLKMKALSSNPSTTKKKKKVYRTGGESTCLASTDLSTMK
jgi:hypothetical protein